MKGIEWIKLTTNMCEDEKMRLMDSMEERDLAYYLWIRLLLQAGKVNDNGLIYLTEDVPYTKEMLSILFNRPLAPIEKVLGIFESFKMIEIYENNVIKICNWEKHQNIEGMRRVREIGKERVRNHREKKKMEESLEENKNLSENDNNNKSSNITTKKDKSCDNKNCNADVTLQKERREKENKNKKKNIDKQEKREKEDIDNRVCTRQHDGSFDNKANEIEPEENSKSSENLDVQAFNIVKSLEKVKVNIKGLTTVSIRDVLAIHKDKYVKMAIEKAVERNKPNMNYVNGILKNWLSEGYPKTYEEDKLSGIKEKPKLRFINFESREYDYDDLEKKLLGWQ